MRFIGPLLFSVMLAATMAAAQRSQVQPSRDINWPSCAAGQAYSPNGNTCLAPGGAYTNPIGAILQVNQYPGSTFDVQLANCIAAVNSFTGGTCDARGYNGTITLAGTITVGTPNVHIYLPCATINTAYSFIVTATTRNVHLEGCTYQGGSTANGTLGGTVWNYTGSGNAFSIGDTTFVQDTKGFWMQNVDILTPGAGSAAQGIYFYRAQEVRLDNIYLNGNNSTGQTAITLDGSGNYAGGTFIDVVTAGFGTGLNLYGNTSPAGSYANASTFVKTHINCSTSGGNPITGTYGINIQYGDGNMFDGGDVEGCDTMFHLGAHAINNTVYGLRNENSNYQYVADSGSTYNMVFTGGTFFTNKLIDNGSRNSFWDAFHRTVNGVKGDWYASQVDSTIINKYRLGIGAGNVRGLEWESQVDQGTSSSVYNWIWGLTDGTSGQSNWIFQDLLNNVLRIQVQEYNSAGGNNQTAISGAGTGGVCFNCAANAGTGGVAFSSGGATPTTVATIDHSGNAYFAGTFQAQGQTNFSGNVVLKNNADTENDYVLQAGATAAQNESFTFKDYTGTSRWYLENNAANQFKINNATGGLDPFRAYDSTGTGDVYIGTTNSGGTLRFNNQAGQGSAIRFYTGGSSPQVEAYFGGTSTIQFPGMASTGYPGLLQADNSGYLAQTNKNISSGTVTSTGGTYVTYYFTYGYASTPQCTVTPTTSTGTFYISSQTTAGFTINYQNSGVKTFNVICFGSGGAF